jgi:drug/metabolite transporter (DMT)-like permease
MGAEARVYAAMGLATVAVAFSSIFVTELHRLQVEPATIAFYRMLLAAAMLIVPALIWRQVPWLAGRDLALLALGGLSLAIHFGAWIASLKYIPISTAIILVDSHPLFVVIASYFFFKERPSSRILFGTAAGLAGAAIIFGGGFKGLGREFRGEVLALAGALAMVSYLMVGRALRARLSLLGYVVPLYLLCAAFLLAWIAITRGQLLQLNASAWAYLLALSIVPTIFGHTLFNWAIKHVGASAVSVAFLGEPVIASLLAFFFYGQRPPTETFIGGPLVLAGIYLTTTRKV